MNIKHIKNIGLLCTLFCFFSLVQAVDVMATTGVCANCHVMHASHTDATTTTTNTPANQLLTASDCIGCHGETYKTDDSIPTVDADTDMAAGTGELAGGSFYWVDETGSHGDRYGHNVDEITNNSDTPFTGNPPGFSTHTDFNPIGDTFWASKTLRCAGQWGCHGNHTDSVSMKAMDGAHHSNQADANALDGLTIGTSFRFLLGVKGKEDADWERTFIAASDHNVYYGVENANDLTAGDDNATISFYCARCHGDFHSDDASGSGGLNGGTWGTDWVRHPVDYSIPQIAGTEYASYKVYKQSAPVATSDLTNTASTAVTVANYRVVMCLSCHRSHGSEFEHMLRFDDQAMIVGGAAGNAGEGCFACHSDKE